MSLTHIVGIDPGLVHTGVVAMLFGTSFKTITVQSWAVAGPDVTKVQGLLPLTSRKFIEGYRPRSHFQQDERMAEAVREFNKRLPHSRVLNNTGVKQVVRRPLMELLGVWDFAVPTHHQDLRSAARIALYGMLKDPELNQLLSDVVRDHLNGDTWKVRR